MAAEGSNPQGPLCSDKAGFDYTNSVFTVQESNLPDDKVIS